MVIPQVVTTFSNNYYSVFCEYMYFLLCKKIYCFCVKDNLLQFCCGVGEWSVCMLSFSSGVINVKLGSIVCGSGGFEKNRFEKSKIKIKFLVRRLLASSCLLGEEDGVDVGQHSTLGNGDTSQ